VALLGAALQSLLDSRFAFTAAVAEVYKDQIGSLALKIRTRLSRVLMKFIKAYTKGNLPPAMGYGMKKISSIQRKSNTSGKGAGKVPSESVSTTADNSSSSPLLKVPSVGLPTTVTKATASSPNNADAPTNTYATSADDGRGGPTVASITVGENAHTLETATVSTTLSTPLIEAEGGSDSDNNNNLAQGAAQIGGQGKGLGDQGTSQGSGMSGSQGTVQGTIQSTGQGDGLEWLLQVRSICSELLRGNVTENSSSSDTAASKKKVSPPLASIASTSSAAVTGGPLMNKVEPDRNCSNSSAPAPADTKREATTLTIQSAAPGSAVAEAEAAEDSIEYRNKSMAIAVAAPAATTSRISQTKKIHDGSNTSSSIITPSASPTVIRTPSHAGIATAARVYEILDSLNQNEWIKVCLSCQSSTGSSASQNSHSIPTSL
jgi:hypothetical protein